MENKLTIAFRLENEFGEKYSQDSTLNILTNFGDTELRMIGRQLNAFLNQCGYIRCNENILMQDITDEEYEALADFLEDLREEKK